MLAAVAFAVLPVRIKELVYGNIQQGDDLVKGVQAWMLAPVLKIHDGTRGTVYELCKVFLCPAFRLSLLRLISRPNAWKSSRLVSWYILISPLYYFTFRV